MNTSTIALPQGLTLESLLRVGDHDFRYSVLTVAQVIEKFPISWATFLADIAKDEASVNDWVSDARIAGSHDAECLDLRLVQKIRISFAACDGNFTKVFTSLAGARKRAAGHGGDGGVSSDGISRLVAVEVRGRPFDSWDEVSPRFLFA